MNKTILSFVLLLTPALVLAKIQTKVIDYKDGKTVLEGYLAWDDSIHGKRPGVLVVHEWWGHGEYVRGRARRLAKLGYVAFALDMYGKGVYAKDHETAAKLSGNVAGNFDLLLRRAKAGLAVLERQSLLDKSKIAAIGYCFGGRTVLEMARAGLDLDAVVSFHGILASSYPKKVEHIKAKILVCQGGSDGFVSQEQINAFKKEMTEAGADWQLNIYGGAVHSFSVKSAGNDPSTGMAYNEQADHRSWAEMKRLFSEVF